MKKLSKLNGDFEYDLLDENQHDTDLREKLALLYESPFSDILWWELRDHSLVSDGYYKLFYYEQSVLKHIILFKYAAKSEKKIVVINKSFKILAKDIQHICQILFSEFDNLQQIFFDGLFAIPEKTPKIFFEKDLWKNDIIISLPESMDAYWNSLGSSTRKKIKLITNRIARDFSDFEVRYLENSEISLEQIEKLVSFNRNRMKTKGEVSRLNDLECKALYHYASKSGFGFLCLCTIDNEIIGGTINTIIGEHAYMHVIAHNNSYNHYSVGQIALINATKYLIEEKNIKHYHLLFGVVDYKFRHGGINHDLYTVRIFKKNNFYCFWGKTVGSLRIIYRSFKQIIKNNKTFYQIYSKLKMMNT